MSWAIWAIIAIVLLILETLTVDFFFLMISLGAFATTIVAIFNLNLPLQVIVFAIVSILALLFIRPFARKHINSNTGKDSNVYALKGREAIALNEITDNSGRVKIGGEVWSARSGDGNTISAGEEVLVAKIDGAYAIVYRNKK